METVSGAVFQGLRDQDDIQLPGLWWDELLFNLQDPEITISGFVPFEELVQDPPIIDFNPIGGGTIACNDVFPLTDQFGPTVDMATAMSCADSLEEQLLQNNQTDWHEPDGTAYNAQQARAQWYEQDTMQHFLHSRKRKLVSMSNTCSETTVKDGNGQAAGAMIVYGLSERKTKRQFNQDERHKTAETRRLHACERCKKLKKRCDRDEHNPFQLCGGCSIAKPYLLKSPCFLETLLGLQLFRMRACVGHPLEILRKSVHQLEDIAFTDRNMKTIWLTQDVGRRLSVQITRFLPEPGDKTAHVYKDSNGRQQTMEMPPYCITAMAITSISMLEYVQQSRNLYIEYVHGSNDMTRMVFDQARRYAFWDHDSTVRKALDLFAASRIIECDWRICDGDNIDIPLITDPNHPWFDKRPITPMMDCQLDQLVIQGFLQPLRAELLEELQDKVNNARKEKWFEIFLTIFILLANTEQQLAHSRRNAIRHGAKARYNSPTLAVSYFHACKTMIAHFHFACNFAMNPLLDWKSKIGQRIAKLDAGEIDFLRDLQGKAMNKRTELLGLRAGQKFEEPSYWTHQLFFDGWNAGNVQEERRLISATA